MSLRRWMIVVAVLSFAATLARWFLLLHGHALHDDRLRIGMTKSEVRAAVGAVRIEVMDDSRWIIKQSGSLYWLEIDFDSGDRVAFFKRESF